MLFNKKNFSSGFGRLLLIFLLGNIFCASQGFTQSYFPAKDSSKFIVYDDRLIPLDFDSIARKEKCVVIITGYSCVGCVEYFAKEKIAKTFIYFINDLSIMEMNRVKFQHDPSCQFYFVLRGFEAGAIRYSEKSPLLAIPSANGTIIYDYFQLNQLTKEFTLKGKKTRKNLGI